MGIQHLFPFVKKACKEGSISELRGCSVAVDVSCLLHRGLFGCSEKLAMGEDTRFYVYYVNKYVKALLALGCHIILVFDGRPLSAKKDTNAGRRVRREENRKAGELLMSQGKTQEAVDMYKRATSITAEVVETTIQAFRNKTNIDILVSPYESDAQLAFLTKEGLADAVVTEDSDLIAFGCEKIIFKWNADTGTCTIYERERLPLCFTGKMAKNFNFDMFRRICIMAGCDYSSGLPGIGLAKAVTFFSKTERSDLRAILPRVPHYLNMPKLKVSKEFVEEFIRAENTFLHQIVFDPRGRTQRPLNPWPVEDIQSQKSDDSSMATCDNSYAGVITNTVSALRLALGNDINNSQLCDKFLLSPNVDSWSIWADDFETSGKRKLKEEVKKRVDARKCGVFQLDTTDGRRVKKRNLVLVDNQGEIDLSDSPEEKPSTAASKQTEIGNAKRRPHARKDISVAWNVDNMMKLYGVDDSNVAAVENDEIKIETKQAEDSVVASDVSADIIFVESKIENEVPAEPATSSENAALEKPKSKVLTPLIKKSPYFAGRTPKSLSNPFRVPKFESQPLQKVESPQSKATLKESKLSVLSEESNSGQTAFSISSFKFNAVGFRASGLRRSK